MELIGSKYLGKNGKPIGKVFVYLFIIYPFLTVSYNDRLVGTVAELVALSTKSKKYWVWSSGGPQRVLSVCSFHVGFL